MTNGEPGHCPVCGRRIPRDTPLGLCTGCMLAAGLAEDQGEADAIEPPPVAGAAAERGPAKGGSGLSVRCPQCGHLVGLASGAPLSSIHCDSCGTNFSVVDEAAASQAAADLGQIGQFQVVERLGTGAFGTVWKARDTRLDRWVAIKIPRHRRLEPAEEDKFLREARAAAQLRHPNIVSVHEVGREDDLIYIVCDFVEGVSLADWLASHRMSPREAASLGAKLARALQHAHDSGVIHRDVKPQNILLDHAGEPHLADFGLARREAGEVTLTLDGQLLGTPAYMSPEQARGEAHAADRRTDIYSLGAVLFQVLTGELPFRGNARMILQQVLQDEPPRLRRLNAHVPRDLETVTLKCLEKDPGRRYATAGELADELERFLKGEPIRARSVGPAGKTWRWCRRKPILAALVGALTMALVAVAVVSTSAALRIARERDAAERESYYAAIGLANSHIKDGKIRQALEVLWKCPERYRQWEWGRLLYLCHQDIASWQAHSNNVVQLTFDPRGQYLLSLDKLGTAKVWDWMEQRLVWSLGEGTNRVLAAAFNPTDGQLVASTVDGQVRLWDLLPLNVERSAAGQEPQRSTSNAQRSTFREPAQLDVESWTLKVERLSAQPKASSYRPKQLLKLAQDQLAISTLLFSPDGRWLAGSDGRQTVRVWDGASGTEVMTLQDCPTPVASLTFGPQSDTLAISSASKVSWRSTPGGREVSHFVAPAPDSRVFACPTGALYAVIDSADRLQVWHKDRAVHDFGTLRRSPPQQGQSRVFFSPQGRWLCAAGHNNTARVWNTETWEEQLAMPGRVYEPRFSPDERFMATIGWTDGASIWDLERRRKYREARGHEFTVQSVALSGDGRFLATGDWNGLIKVWSARSGGERIETESCLNGAGYSADGRLFVAAPWGLGIRVFEADSGHLLRHIRVPGEAFCWFAFSPDGRHLAAADANKAALVFDVETGAVVHRLGGHKRQLQDVAYSRDGREIATGSLDGTVKLWDAETGGELSAFNAHAAGVLQVVFTPDGERLITSGWDGYVRLWRRATREMLAECSLGAARPGWLGVDLKCSRDGRLVAVACMGDSFRLLETRSLARVDTPLVRGGNCEVCWTLDNQRLVTGSSRGYGYGLDYGSVELWSVRDHREVLTVGECEEIANTVACHPTGLRLAAASMDFSLYQWHAFPWDTKTYNAVSGATLPERVGRYARAYWQKRLRAEAVPAPPVREIEVPFDRRLVPPRDPAATPAQVDLTEHYTGLLSDPLFPPADPSYQDNDLSNLPVGLVELGGVWFDIRGVIRLRATRPGGRPGTLIWGQYPARAGGIKIGRRFERLHVLHGAAGGWIHTLDGAREPVSDGTPIARFTFHYADGSQRADDVVYGRDVRDWWEGPGDRAGTERGQVAWRGTNAVAGIPDLFAGPDGARLRLYRTAWTNTQPEKVVTEVDYESLLTACGPFLVAIAVE